ncbi:Uncharacterized conserved protein YtfP, gamma-glutamylcyclotransferase (GGCT)/AIG2-like family [Variovorax sp. HW608]|uniref:gamma-glutamylcyclotransferase family protein n=1 Tax=Variovorax sp. HW608 TaxID=1034889 RepID=UPI00081FE4A1|nr:gamma-glutamylcyclotransferase family protein [Variovorax sp. HW608]SCK12592.1 Uncharacterized conserved protein YtfP, gamma-glutamylcyclotransferase (GGCT)/AIG2-like family [Variovorax sp. HW608]
MGPSLTFLYFAYGSNMSSRRLCADNRAPSALAVGPGCLVGHRLVFDKIGMDGSAKADCHYTGDTADIVEGGLFRIAEDDAHALDKAEGATDAKPGYRRIEVAVSTGSGVVTARTYLAIEKSAVLLPYTWYLNHVLVGAREFALSAAYIARIEQQKTIADPDSTRTVREIGIYA